MGAVTNEPSMEDILSSIKRIIADEDQGRPTAAPRAPRRRPNPAQQRAEAVEPVADDQVLELTDALANDEPATAGTDAQTENDEATAMTPPAKPAEKSPEKAAAKAAATSPEAPATVISETSAQAARQSLSHLSALLIRPEEAPANTLEGLVREMLRPMLKEWLDANLPELVESLVKREIDRITGRGL